MCSLYPVSQHSILLFQDHLMSITLLTQRALCPKRLQKWLHRWPFQDHLPSKFLPAPRARFHFYIELQGTPSYADIKFLHSSFHCYISDSGQFIYVILIVFQIKSQFLCHCTHNWHATEQIWLSYCEYEAHSNYAECHIDQHFWIYLLKYNQLQQVLHILLPNMCQKQIYASNAKHMTMYTLVHGDMRQQFQYIYMPHMNSIQSTMWPGAVAYIHYTLLTSTYRFHITALISQETTNCNFHLACYCHVCAIIKYAP